MKNIGEMMRQAQQMQQRMQEMQDRLAETEVTGRSAAGMVEIAMNGKGVARRARIDPSLLKADEAEVLEDLVVAAINDARAKADAHAQEEMAKLTGGLKLPPGMKLPF
ncbi:MAG: YbaB/EbfC family nucleoid-associated protein [Alphaproteobacteria bacterium]